MQTFHPPLFKQQTKGGDATRQQSSGRSVLFPLSALNNRAHTSNQFLWHQELEKMEAS